nr:prephenate dehydrogenase/arogenate dehydrogenase family protein [Kiritimatiellia bacterium]
YAVPRLAGGGFASTVRLAKSSPDMWVPIFEQNRDAILAAVAAFSDRVAAFTRCLEERDWDRLDAYIREANRIRDLL